MRPLAIRLSSKKGTKSVTTDVVRGRFPSFFVIIFRCRILARVGRVRKEDFPAKSPFRSGAILPSPLCSHQRPIPFSPLTSSTSPVVTFCPRSPPSPPFARFRQAPFRWRSRGKFPSILSRFFLREFRVSENLSPDPCRLSFSLYNRFIEN